VHLNTVGRLAAVPLATDERLKPVAATTLTPIPHIVTDRVEVEPRGLVGWLTTTDHKRIGILYMVTSFVFFMLGGVEALMMRMQLSVANNNLIAPEVESERLMVCRGFRCLVRVGGRVG
jgi:hypothetical protein